MSTDQVGLEDRDLSTLLRLYRNSEARRQTAEGRVKYEEATQRSNQIERVIEDRFQRVENVLRNMLDCYERMMEDINHGASFYSAETLRLMNEAPAQARTILSDLESDAE